MLQQATVDSESLQARERQIAYDIWHAERDPVGF